MLKILYSVIIGNFIICIFFNNFFLDIFEFFYNLFYREMNILKICVL